MMAPAGTLVPALRDDFNPEAAEHNAQLVLDDSAFRAIKALAEGGVLTPTSLALDPDMPYAKVAKLASFLGGMNRSCSFWIGDLLNHAEASFGETFAQIAHETGLAEQTLLNRMSVCKHVPASVRRSSLPFSVHAEVASLKPKEQRYWLDKAERGGWTRAELRERMKAKRHDEKPPIPGIVDSDLIVELASRILHTAQPCEDGQHYKVENELIAQLRGALGEEDSTTG